MIHRNEHFNWKDLLNYVQILGGAGASLRAAEVITGIIISGNKS